MAKKFVYTSGLSASGWGIEGVFEADVKITYGGRKGLKGRHRLIDEGALVIGYGSGYEGFVMDEKWLRRAVELINEHGLEKKR